MKNHPFFISEQGKLINDTVINSPQGEIDGDIVIADSYRKHTRLNWGNSLKVKALLYISIIVFAVLISKLYYIQVLRGALYYGAAEGNRIQQLGIQAPRGVIYSSNQTRLAFNVPDFALSIIPRDLPNSQEEEDLMFTRIAEILGLEHFDLVESFIGISRTSQEQWELVRDISQEQAILLLRESKQWPGVTIEPVEQRSYAIQNPLSHVLGYTGKLTVEEYEQTKESGYFFNEHIGKTGLEKSYQKILRGTPGYNLIETNSLGKHIRILETAEPSAGDNLYLHINEKLQEFIWKELEPIIKEKELPGASVIVMNPNNGAVLALVSYPGYNNEQLARGISNKIYTQLVNDPRKPLFHRTIAGEYPSGSTIKLVVGTAALEEGIVTQYDSVQSTGGIQVNEYWFPDWKYGGHGATNIRHALAESVNTYFYAIGGGYQNIEGLGVERISQYGKRFGLSRNTGIDLPEEHTGFLPSKEWKEEAKGERWYLGDTYHLAIGQGDILVTPLQVANFTAAIANGGTLYKPQLVDRIGAEFKNASKVSPEIIDTQIASINSISIVRKGLRDAVIYGTARSLSTLATPIAGKTGTAQFSQYKDPHAWFTGFAPYNNPEVVVTVLVEEGEGGDITATPIAKKIFEWYEKNN